MAHVQGLRGLAIALVVLYHLRPELCPCGYFGVDLFLVISGFLIFRNGTTRHGTSRLGSYLLENFSCGIACLSAGVCLLPASDASGED